MGGDRGVQYSTALQSTLVIYIYSIYHERNSLWETVLLI